MDMKKTNQNGLRLKLAGYKSRTLEAQIFRRTKNGNTVKLAIHM
jgi:hypothetical protein